MYGLSADLCYILLGDALTDSHSPVELVFCCFVDVLPLDGPRPAGSSRQRAKPSKTVQSVVDHAYCLLCCTCLPDLIIEC
jgi:hypothetical protein